MERQDLRPQPLLGSDLAWAPGDRVWVGVDYVGRDPELSLHASVDPSASFSISVVSGGDEVNPGIFY